MKIQQAHIAVIAAITLGNVFAASPQAQRLPPNVSNLPSIFDGVVKKRADSPEVSTAEFQKALDDASAIILDARPYEEYAVSHIPGALTVPGKPGTTPAPYVADVSEIVKRVPDKAQPLILYCNGLFCGRSERAAEELLRLPPGGGIFSLTYTVYFGRHINTVSGRQYHQRRR